MDAIEGWRGRIAARGVNISMDAWRIKASTTKVPANDFESRFRRNKHGLKGCEVEFSGYVDVDNNPFADAGGGTRAGEQIACDAYLIKGALLFRFTALDIFEVETKDEVDGKVDITVRGESNGSWTYPGSVPA
jgi:hypothetical protein